MVKKNCSQCQYALNFKKQTKIFTKPKFKEQ